MASTSTFQMDTFWPHLERERSHVIDTRKTDYKKALRELRECVDKNNEEGQTQKNEKNADTVKANKREMAGKLREVEKFITPKAPQNVRKGLSDLRVYLGKRLTIAVIDDRC